MACVLVTGGAGYIGSHTCKQLAREGADVVVYDNLSTGHADLVKWGTLVGGALEDRKLILSTLKTHRPDAVIHFAAASLVGDSMRNPGFYFRNNVGGTLSLLQAMCDSGVDKIIVSSTCAVYGKPEQLPIPEEAPMNPMSPYGASKLFMERMCHDFAAAHGLRWVSLRYFNACGADPEGEIGERHSPETHLIPRVLMAIDGELECLEIYGDNYETADGTCERDYINVNDLSDAHIKAMNYLEAGGASDIFNLGTGTAYSVRKILDAAAAITGQEVPHKIAPRRPGDPPRLLADPSKAKRILDWTAVRSSLPEILDTAWRWHQADRSMRRHVWQHDAEKASHI